MTDIVLDQGTEGDWIRVEGQVLHVSGACLMLGDSVDPSTKTTWRRALVRTPRDTLVVNHERDFARGVALDGVRIIAGHVEPNGAIDVTSAEIGVVDCPSLKIVGEIFVEPSPAVAPQFSFDEETQTRSFVSLQQTISGLQERIATLEAQIAELTAKLP